MIIGGLSGISYGTFAGALCPVAAAGLILSVLLISLIYRRESLTRERFPAVAQSAPRYDRPLVIKSVIPAPSRSSQGSPSLTKSGPDRSTG